MLIYKIFEESCDVCNHMKRHDKATFESFPELEYREADLNEVLDYASSEKPQTMLRLYQTLEKYALNPDYTVDLPVYIFMAKSGEYKGHHVGAATIVKLRDTIKQCLEDTPE
jgi:hypothetical protein